MRVLRAEGGGWMARRGVSEGRAKGGGIAGRWRGKSRGCNSENEWSPEWAGPVPDLVHQAVRMEPFPCDRAAVRMWAKTASGMFSLRVWGKTITSKQI